MKNIGLLTLFCAFYFLSSAQDNMIIYFKDKQSTQSIQLTDLALKRRAKNNVIVDHYDIPVTQSYLSQISAVGSVLNVSRWLNAVSYSSNLSNQELMQQFPFIASIKRYNHCSPKSIDKNLNNTKSLDYGASFNQIDQIGLNCLHDLGFTGQGIYLAVIDAGFINMNTIEYFDSVYIENRVLDMYDFVNNASVYDYSTHGTLVSSCIVAEKIDPDKYIGTAKDVNLALYVSEDITSETELEEFNLVAALERCDSVGIDVVNISLGYVEFDDSVSSHSYSDLDGVTTIAAKGVNIAYSKGILVSASAGNSGPGTIGTPCDADHCLCIGAIDENGDYASFSSIGPSADNQVKPDVATRGKDTWVISENGLLIQGSGTSFSSPVMAGGLACLMQAHPASTVDQIMDAVRMSASQFATPDIFLGYGIPDFCEAHDILTNSASLPTITANDFTIYPIPATDFIEISTSLNNEIVVSVYSVSGEKVHITKIEKNVGSSKIDVRSYSSGVYTVVLKDLDSGFFVTKQITVNH